MQQHVVEHEQHDKALKKSWSSTASGLSSRCPDNVLPLDPARSGRESEVDSVRLSLTIIQFIAYVILIIYTQQQQEHIREKKVREKSRQCNNHKPQPFPDPKRKRKSTNPNKHKSNKRTKALRLALSSPSEVIAILKGLKNTRPK